MNGLTIDHIEFLIKVSKENQKLEGLSTAKMKLFLSLRAANLLESTVSSVYITDSGRKALQELVMYANDFI